MEVTTRMCPYCGEYYFIEPGIHEHESCCPQCLPSMEREREEKKQNTLPFITPTAVYERNRIINNKITMHQILEIKRSEDEKNIYCWPKQLKQHVDTMPYEPVEQWFSRMGGKEELFYCKCMSATLLKGHCGAFENCKRCENEKARKR